MERVIFSLLALILVIGFTCGVAQAVATSSHDGAGSAIHTLKVIDIHALQSRLVD